MDQSINQYKNASTSQKDVLEYTKKERLNMKFR